ncbi:four helix bundle protein [Neolewinella litorea]|uniref:Four helix bundle protein n=1 Tax=Neolewinella litorea TaxID=2562452 RepID=A0A4S4NI25_9BACT|nr:four helix bundle protein [Neolewinella litorea]THH39376.1 four helix bundle protein [Neolewinella litorea]
MAFSRFKEWAAYRKARSLSTSILHHSAAFPREERYSLTDQIRRSSRSVCANLGEAYAKRCYPKHFHAKLTDSAGENFETQVWLDFALDCGYINQATHQRLTADAEEVGKLLSFMQRNPEKFLPGKS